MTMRFAYHASMCPPEQYVPLVQAAEAAGFDTFTVADSICYPQFGASKYPYNKDGSREFLDGVPFLDPFTLISAMAMVTETIGFSTSVVKLAIRQPVVVAKQASSTAIIANNRFKFGVGISPWREDFDACQIPWENRGKRMDEMIEIVRGLMSGDYFSYQGELLQLDPIKLCPVPSSPMPILLGGHARPALERAARLCDGFIHAGGEIQEQKRMIDEINEYRKQYQRDHLPFEFHLMSAEAYSVDGVQRLRDIGADEAIVAFRNVYASEPDTKTVAQKIDEINWYGETVIAPSKAVA
jgi:probable F420-dependent oxidoreductase